MGEMDNLAEVRRDGQEYRVIVAGAGLGGLCAALTFMKADIGPIAILEKNHEVGGVWSANTYPGCACDIPAHLYSLSFETDMDWSCFYPKQTELLEYQKKVVAKHRLQERNILQLQSEVVDAHWREESQRWEVLVRDTRDQSLRLLVTQFLVPSTGALFDPIIPNLKGLDLFQGPTMHTARWDHTVDFRGKRVAVIGTGASSIQVVAALAPVCGHLSVFQRTPAWVLPKYNFTFPNWATLVMRYVPGQRWLFRQLLFWQREIHMAPAFFKPGGVESRLLTLAAKRNISKVVKDRELRKALTPDYTLGCKRVLVSDAFYPAMVRENVSLVSSAVTGVTRDGVIDAKGKVHPLDIIVWATGFNLKAIYHQMEAYGVGGKSWTEHMGGEGAMWAHLGVTSPGLPNMFLMSGPNTGLGHNSVILMIEAQAKYIRDIIRQMDAEGASVAEVQQEAWLEYSEEMKRRLTSTVWKKGGCSSWYLGEEGKYSDVLWPSTVLEYQRRLGRADMSPFNLTDSHNRPVKFTGALRRRWMWQTGLRLGLGSVLLAMLLLMVVPRVWPKAMLIMTDGSDGWASTNGTCPSRWSVLGLLWHAVSH